jgi:hypothetical protein
MFRGFDAVTAHTPLILFQTNKFLATAQRGRDRVFAKKYG